MMFSHLFENHNKVVGQLLKIGDCLSRSLRENVILFSINADDNTVSYVTENSKIITGRYKLGNDLILEAIEIEDLSLFTDEKKFDGFVGGKIHEFVASIFEDKHKDASVSFSNILGLWENRLKFEKIQKRLTEKVSKFNGSNKIVETQEFQRFLEMADQVVKFLKEHKSKITKISEIKNAAILSNSISEAFDFPRLDYDDLKTKKAYKVKDGINKSIYEMICQQELIKKELLENKANFDTVWATNDSIKNLAGHIFSQSDEVYQALAEAIIDVPYLALASKKQLTETFTNALKLGVGELKDSNITPKDIQEYSSAIFELKKEVRRAVLNTLNEKYGINVQNLKEPMSFNSLLNTQVVIFETLSKISPKGSVQREVLSEVANMLKDKTGVEAIDVNDVLQEVFQVAGYNEHITEMDMGRSLDFGRIAGDLGEIGLILKMIKQMGGAGDPAAAMGGAQSGAGPMGGAMPGAAPMGGAPQPDPMSAMQNSPMAPKPQMGAPMGSPVTPQGGDTMGGMPPNQQGTEDDDVSVPPGNDPLGPEGQEGGMIPPSTGMEGGEAPIPLSQDQLMATMSELEQLMADLKMEIGGGEQAGMPGDLPDEGGMGMEGEEGGFGDEEQGFGDEEGGGEEFGGDDEINIDTGDGDDDVHIDQVDGEHDMDSDDEEGGGDEPEEKPKKKGNPFKKK